jgi:putative SbcD/Mre11-related phosphoesterase
MEQQLSLGPGRVGHASGALYVETSGTLVVADAHLGYGWAQRRRGQMGPVTDGGIGERLRGVVREFAARELVFLGDTVHAPRPSVLEREMIEGVLRGLMEVVEVKVVAGNHDRAFGRDFAGLGIAVSGVWREGGLVGLHGDRLDVELPEGEHYLLGHLHPAVKLADDAGVARRAPAFLVGERATVLPAFSPFAAGFDVKEGKLPREVKALLGRHEVVVATGRRVVRLPARANRSVR